MQNFAGKTKNTVEQITEDIIKKVVLRFLRRYYKFRLRYEDQPVQARYDLEGVGGIIADGYYSFRKTDGKLFTATFEATSKASREEVIYKPQKQILFWDGVAVAAIFTVFMASLNLRFHFHTLDNTLLGERIAITLLVFCLFLFLFFLVAKNFGRYRYIYAIEQFKKYFADEQWIALAADVFGSTDDRYLRELKNQCVYNGFGLLIVDEKLDPKILITPSRQDIFMGKRKNIAFASQKEMEGLAKKGRFGPFWGIFGSKLPGFLQKDQSYLRYRKTFYYQMLILAGCLVFISTIFSKELQNPNFTVVSKEQFTEEIARSKSNNLAEQEAYLDESEAKKKLPKEDFWQLKKPKAEPAPPSKEQPRAAENDAPKEEVLTSRGVEDYLIYDCSRFYNFNGKKYIIQEGIYASWEPARQKLEQLRSAGIESMALLRSCFSKNQLGYIVHAGLIYNTEAEAWQEFGQLRQAQPSFEKQMKEWKITAIEPVVE